MITLLILQLLLPNIKLTPGIATDIKVENLCPVTLVLTGMPPINSVARSKVLFSYGLLTDQREYTIDILIPIELGGEVAIKNLWPIPYATRRDTIIAKTLLEHKLHDLVCSGELSLKDAQDAISSNWVLAYYQYIED